MSFRAGMTAELRISLEFPLVLNGEDEGNVVVIDEGHERVVFGHSEDSFADEVDKASLVSDVEDRGVDGDDHLAHLSARCIESTLDLEIANAALLGVGTEDVVVFVDEAIELVLQVFNAGAFVIDLELKVGGEDGHDFVALGGFASRLPQTTVVTTVLGSWLLEESETGFTNSVTHGSLAPGDSVVAGTVMDNFGNTTAGRHGVDWSLEVRASLNICAISSCTCTRSSVEDRHRGGRRSSFRHRLRLHDEGISSIG